MITVKDWMEVVSYRITEGGPYGWNCYGSNTHQLSAWNGIHGKGGWSANIVFDTQTQNVYQVEVCDYTNDRAYRLINAVYKEHYKNASAEHGEFADQAWDDVDFVDLETDEDWLEKALAIVEGMNYDTRVQVPVDFTDEELLKYMKLAHERDITFNQFVEEALRNVLEEFERDPEGLKARAKIWKENQ